MGETLDQTRIELEAQRVQMQRTADQLKARVKRSVDVKAKFKENPALFIGLGAGAVFLLAGGPMRAARFARRRLMRSAPEKAYDSLPQPMQSWVDSLAGRRSGQGRERSPGARRRAREVAAGAAQEQEDAARSWRSRWSRVRPGPDAPAGRRSRRPRAIISAALARKAVERFLSGEPRRDPREWWQNPG